MEDLFYRMAQPDKFFMQRPLVMKNAGIEVDGRLQEKLGTSVVSANSITLPTDGNMFTITGNTELRAIATAGWKNGSEITLLFTGTPTVKNNTAGASGTAKLFLAGSADCTTIVNNSMLTLRYDGTQWQEKCRKIA